MNNEDTKAQQAFDACYSNLPDIEHRLRNDATEAAAYLGWKLRGEYERQQSPQPTDATTLQSEAQNFTITDALVKAVEAEQKADFELNSKEFWWNAGLHKAVTLIRQHTQPSPPSGEVVERVRELENALRPFTRLNIPHVRKGNAGAYPIRHADIEAARLAIRQHTPPSEEELERIADAMAKRCWELKGKPELINDQSMKGKCEVAGIAMVELAKAALAALHPETHGGAV